MRAPESLPERAPTPARPPFRPRTRRPSPRPAPSPCPARSPPPHPPSSPPPQPGPLAARGPGAPALARPTPPAWPARPRRPSPGRIAPRGPDARLRGAARRAHRRPAELRPRGLRIRGDDPSRRRDQDRRAPDPVRLRPAGPGGGQGLPAGAAHPRPGAHRGRQADPDDPRPQAAPAGPARDPADLRLRRGGHLDPRSRRAQGAQDHGAAGTDPAGDRHSAGVSPEGARRKGQQPVETPLARPRSCKRGPAFSSPAREVSTMAIYRSRNHSMIAGVCGGLADWLGWSPTMVRLLYVILSIVSAGFPGLLVYLILWIAMPKAPVRNAWT